MPSLPGPALSPLDALIRVAEAPVIAMLHGSGGATLVWHDQLPAQSADPLVALRQAASAALPIPGDRTWGSTWAAVPPGATLIQLDYEFPRTPPLLIPADHLVRWDAAGRCTLHGPDEARLRRMAAQLHAAAPEPPPPRLLAPLVPAWNAAAHQARVERIRAWIASGDCYQINLAVSFSGRLGPAAQRDVAFFRQLVTNSPAPYAAFFRAPGRASVISHSPECLLAARGERLCSVPIKGTRRRLPGRDLDMRAELCHSAKDHAELAMIVDLVRHDLGRIAIPGSVQVEDDGLTIDLPYVHHRAARIVASRRAGTSLAEALLAVFPAGSITGAPKIRVMQLLTQLESGPRGPYCGSFGWISADAADLAVAIRTASVRGEQVTLHAGGGVVWDSDGAAEWDEAQAKAAGLAAALESHP